MSDETLGQRIRRLRQERGMSLAKVVGGDFSRAFLNQVEMGKSQPSTRVLRVIASRLGTQVEYLLDGSTPTLDREIALEKGRADVARGNARRALAELEPALDSRDWPLGVDARLAAAEALIALGRGHEAEQVLTLEEEAVRARGDGFRLRRLRAIRSRRPFRVGSASDPRALGEAYAQIADALLRTGRSSAALEHYRTARSLLEAAGQLDGRQVGKARGSAPRRKRTEAEPEAERSR